jgi:hypothetical protein
MPPKNDKLDPVHEIVEPLSELYFDLHQRSTTHQQSKADTITPAKQKIKTRGPSTTKPEEQPDPSASADSTPAQSTIPVHARALKVFRTLFFQPSPSATPGEVAWKDFVHALSSAGFAVQKLY